MLEQVTLPAAVFDRPPPPPPGSLPDLQYHGFVQLAVANPAAGTAYNYEASFEWPDRDILVVHKAYPFSADLAKICEERYLDRFEPCLVAANGKEGARVGEDSYRGKGYDDPSQRSSTRLVLSGGSAAKDLPEEVEVQTTMLLAVQDAIVSLYQRYNPHAEVYSAGGYELLRYEEGQRFGEHVDTIRYDTVLAHRRLAVIAFANEDYDGGELVFPRQGIRIKPEAGMLVLFPATFTHPHEALPPQNGTRYSIVTWFF